MELDKLEQLALVIERKAGAIESITLSLIGRVASWVGPVPVAIFTASELQIVFDTSPLLALISAAAMELIGVNLAARWTKFRLSGAREETLARQLMVGFYGMDFTITTLIVTRRILEGGSFTYLIAALFPIAAALSIISLNQSIGAQRRAAETQALREQRKAETQARQLAPGATQLASQETQTASQETQNNGHHAHICVHCGAEFVRSQGLSAHLRYCSAYQAQKAQIVPSHN